MELFLISRRLHIDFDHLQKSFGRYLDTSFEHSCAHEFVFSFILLLLACCCSCLFTYLFVFYLCVLSFIVCL